MDFLLSMKDGRVYASGTPEEVFTEKMLAEVFRINGRIIRQEGEKPLCLSYDLLEKKS